MRLIRRELTHVDKANGVKRSYFVKHNYFERKKEQQRMPSSDDKRWRDYKNANKD